MTEQTFADKPHAVRITADGSIATVVVNGTDMSEALAGYTLEHRAGQPPLLVLYPSPRHSAAFDGLAHVAVAEPADPGPAAADFLRSINPAALDQAALQRDDLDGSPNELTKAMLAQLIDWAEGRT
ncbi:hypothetical protein [Streptomyces sp. NPDC046371]|uniref:hypothetical protein n=1 Tax=Streptomyces sp. NPDC046371 TaxID=3154916 RepID=UPI0034112902